MCQPIAKAFEVSRRRRGLTKFRLEPRGLTSKATQSQGDLVLWGNMIGVVGRPQLGNEGVDIVQAGSLEGWYVVLR